MSLFVSDRRSRACVYLYRRLDGTVVYAGRGLTPDRAQSHAGGSHNAGLAALIATGKYGLQVAGPYPSYQAAARVEAALISAMARAGRHSRHRPPHCSPKSTTDRSTTRSRPCAEPAQTAPVRTARTIDGAGESCCAPAVPSASAALNWPGNLGCTSSCKDAAGQA